VGYYLLTGTHVFGGATTVEVCSHHLHSLPEPPSARLQGPVPAGLERLILACLEKEPARRPGSAAELRDALGTLDDVGRWSEKEAREWWERWHQGRGEQPHDVAARPSHTLEVALGRRSEEA
jgi:serine/threonine-protein kinase